LSRSLAPGSSLLFYDGKVSSVQNNHCRIASYSLVNADSCDLRQASLAKTGRASCAH
jgi:hypothetical protein